MTSDKYLLFKDSKRYLYKIENFPNREIDEQSFSKPHLGDLCGWLTKKWNESWLLKFCMKFCILDGITKCLIICVHKDSLYVTCQYWNRNILLKFSSLAALEVVILTTSSAGSDENFIKVTFLFQWSWNSMLLMNPSLVMQGREHCGQRRIINIIATQGWLMHTCWTIAMLRMLCHAINTVSDVYALSCSQIPRAAGLAI